MEHEHGPQHHARVWNLAILENDAEVLIGEEIRLDQARFALKVNPIDFNVSEPNEYWVVNVRDQEALQVEQGYLTLLIRYILEIICEHPTWH
jgi:hypothetical protein